MNMAEPTRFRPAIPVHRGTALSTEAWPDTSSKLALAQFEGPSISRTRRAEQINAAIAEIGAQYSASNWDGYGAKAVSGDTLVRAREFLLMLPVAIPLPDVFPEVTGEIAFEWRARRSSTLVVSVADTGRLIFAGRFGSATSNGVDFFSGGIPFTVLAGIRRATRGG